MRTSPVRVSPSAVAKVTHAPGRHSAWAARPYGYRAVRSGRVSASQTRSARAWVANRNSWVVIPSMASRRRRLGRGGDQGDQALQLGLTGERGGLQVG